MTDIVQGGFTANKSGKWLEETIRQQLLLAQYYELTPEEKKKLIRDDGVLSTTGKAWFAPQVRLERNLYDAKYTSDFFVYHADKFPDGLHIECKWQASQGSVDEKYVFTALSLKKFESPTILILAGSGARQGAVKWLKRQNSNKFTFMRLDEFILWAQKEL